VHIADWFLTADEMGNPARGLAPWTTGNAVTPLLDGSAYFSRLVAEVRRLRGGECLFFTDWQGDADELLCPEGPTAAQLLGDAARRGVAVKGLMWRSHTRKLSYSEEANRQLGDDVNDAGGEVLLDQRVRRGGSHHQKLMVLRAPGRDVAFVGGIDLCHGRRDDARHLGDPQAQPMAAEYGPHPPWHDAQLEIHGPAVSALDATFRQRWIDPLSVDTDNPLSWVKDRLRHVDISPDPLPEPPPEPDPAGSCAVQVLRTYPAIRPRTPYAPHGERTVARGFVKALGRAKRLVYLEDQYLWSPHIARVLAAALRAEPGLHLVVVVPRHPDVDGRLALPPNQVGRVEAIQTCRDAAPDRVHVFDLENEHGTPVYVHAKVAVLDDVWATVGSANLNRRSWSHDSELTVAVLDDERDARDPVDPPGRGNGARVFARNLRLELMRRHLDRAPGDDADLLDPDAAVAALEEAATTLDAWHRDGRRGPRPPGRVRSHHPERMSRLTRLWATPLYRVVYDPDGRSVPDRWRGRW
jgi:phosphatidylserine/phosphatidylglycerophosphate/cardiolipin synthase-like enzyme